MKISNKIYLILFMLLSALSVFIPVEAFASASEAVSHNVVNYTNEWLSYVCLLLFAAAYTLVIFEDLIHLRKSKPVMLMAGFIWLIVAYIYKINGHHHDEVNNLLRHNFLEYTELAFFLVSAMTYINTITNRNIFDALRVKLVNMGLSYRSLFWITGVLAFVLSPIADNLTTSLILGAVVLTLGKGNDKFVASACINIVVAANAGGAFSPFGDITTLMVWQKGIVQFFEFFALFFPALISWLIPAVFMSFAIKKGEHPEPVKEYIEIKKGGFIVTGLFLFTIALTVTLHNTLHLPPFLGMVTGLAVLMCYSYYVKHYESEHWAEIVCVNRPGRKPKKNPLDVFVSIMNVEWDTLFFFYGVILCVGGLSALGYLLGLSHYMYTELGATWANSLVGVLSAIIDNIPVMFAVLTMEPDMSHGQWLLVTLTAGIGGSLLSIGSAAGVALMGQARGVYTFFSHIKWSWAIAIGYAAGIWLHIVLNGV